MGLESCPTCWLEASSNGQRKVRLGATPLGTGLGAPTWAPVAAPPEALLPPRLLLTHPHPSVPAVSVSWVGLMVLSPLRGRDLSSDGPQTASPCCLLGCSLLDSLPPQGLHLLFPKTFLPQAATQDGRRIGGALAAACQLSLRKRQPESRPPGRPLFPALLLPRKQREDRP